jgi:hypothetical protein
MRDLIAKEAEVGHAIVLRELEHFADQRPF